MNKQKEQIENYKANSFLFIVEWTFFATSLQISVKVLANFLYQGL